LEYEHALTASQEDYLEAIFEILDQKQAVRAKDIARRLKVKSSSVTGALRVLANKGLINYAPYDVITLTPEGRRIARDVARRHEVLRDFFARILGVEAEKAEEGACRMEHAVPRSVLDKLIRFVEFLEVCPRAGTSWVEAFSQYCDDSSAGEDCVRCTFQCLEELKGKRRREAEEGKELITLDRLRPGLKGKIVSLKGGSETRNRILGMGFRPGALVETGQDDQEDGRIQARMRGYHVSLRKDDAARVVVEVI
jgi:DtxR family transcriptional regulator, Mn-dependent transcriptional regulator